MALSDAVVASLLVKIGADIRNLKRGMGQADKAVSGFGAGTAAAMSTTGAAIQSAGATAMATGAQFDASIGRSARGALMSIIKTGMEFEAATKIMDASTLNLSESMRNDLHKAAVLVGADVNVIDVSAMDAAAGMTNLLKAGMSVTDMFGGPQGLSDYMKDGTNLMGAMGAAAALSAASNLSFAESTDIMAISMATYKIGAKDAIKIADSFVQSADASVASVEGLAAAQVRAGPIQASYGFTLEDTNMQLAILSERGLEGAEAGTALKSMWGNLLRPTKKVQGALEGLGVALYDDAENLRSVKDIVGDLGTALAGLTQKGQIEATKTMFGSYGGLAGGIITGEGIAGMEGMTAAIANAATAAQVAEKRTEGLSGAMQVLDGSVETFSINAAMPLIKDVLTPLATIAADVIGKLATGNPVFLKLAVTALLLGAAFGPLLMGLGGLATVIGTVISAGGALIGFIGGISAPILAVVAALAVLYLAWKNNWLGIRDFLQPILDSIVTGIGTAITAIKGFFVDLYESLVGGSIVPDLVMGILSWFSTLVAQGVSLITGLKNQVLAILGSLANEAYEKGKSLATRFGEGVKRALNKALDAARAIAAAIRALLPGSDAARGPLSDLFASGKALPETLAKGMRRGSAVLGRTAADLAGIAGYAAGGGKMTINGNEILIRCLCECSCGAGKAGGGRGGPGKVIEKKTLEQMPVPIANGIAQIIEKKTLETMPVPIANGIAQALEKAIKKVTTPLVPVGKAIERLSDRFTASKPLGGSRPVAQMPGRTTTNNITITNPSAQTSERSIMQTMRLLSVTGVL